ncbi:hypothetical protein Rmf_03340 [Roseomonas fluvialis]|uniref:Uncharacterized protein n=1 Tax=Roseomonas fluvialis TaxID=1750527 RepID=A0ABM9BQY2_9PROT|nr:hypothetical protein Rmf_03340 [Roseomonas fluvialis]
MRRHIGRIARHDEGGAAAPARNGAAGRHAAPRLGRAGPPLPRQCTVMRWRAITAFAASAAPMT